MMQPAVVYAPDSKVQEFRISPFAFGEMQRMMALVGLGIVWGYVLGVPLSSAYTDLFRHPPEMSTLLFRGVIFSLVIGGAVYALPFWSGRGIVTVTADWLCHYPDGKRGRCLALHPGGAAFAVVPSRKSFKDLIVWNAETREAIRLLGYDVISLSQALRNAGVAERAYRDYRADGVDLRMKKLYLSIAIAAVAGVGALTYANLLILALFWLLLCVNGGLIAHFWRNRDVLGKRAAVEHGVLVLFQLALLLGAAYLSGMLWGAPA